MSQQQYRMIYVGLGLVLVAVLALGFAFGSGGSPVPRPEVIENLSPLPGDQVPRQTPVEIDVPVGYRLELWIDYRGSGGPEANWVKVPDSEIVIVAETGVHSWRPAANRILEAWTPGTQRIRLVWSKTSGVPDSGEYEYSFRVY